MVRDDDTEDVNMATTAVCAELKFRNGEKRNISVQVENNLKSLICGVNELNVNVSQLLSELVEREGARGGRAQGEEDEDSDEDEEEEEKPEPQPPAKRSKT